jgi:twitching motility protein PilT
VPAYEILINNAAVRNLIRENRTHEIDLVIETGLELGMVSLNRSLANLVRDGEITVENAFSYSLNSKGLEGLL